MTLELRLLPNVEAQLLERAAAAGQDVEQFVQDAVIQKLANVETIASSPPNGQDWANRLKACIDLHPVVNHFVDDSRESIYAGRGE
jgi:hypothetical protein